MTLVRSMLTPYGIIMAADSTLTVKYPLTNGEILERHYTDAKKLQRIPDLNAGISWWGEGRIDGMNADVWLENYISKQRAKTLKEFAISLRDELRKLGFRVTEERNIRFGTIGFHLAGFVDFKGKKMPTLYHIHNGISEVYPDIDPYICNANHDWYPERVLEEWEKGHFPGLRNGDILPYAVLSHFLYQFFETLRINLRIGEQPFLIPYPSDNLDVWAEFLRFQIRLIGEIYSLSNYPPIVGGKIITLVLKDDGTYKYEIK